MKLNEFCEKFVAHNTVVCLVQEKIKMTEDVKQHEYNKIWQGMDWQIVHGPGDEDYFKAHPDVEKCPFKNFEVVKVIGNIFNAFPDTADNITIVIGLSYKDYYGSFDYSENDKRWYGKVQCRNSKYGKAERIADLVSYEGETPHQLVRNFKCAVDDYIKMTECPYDPRHEVEVVTNKIKDCIHHCENISQDTDDALCEQIDDIVDTYKEESKK